MSAWASDITSFFTEQEHGVAFENFSGKLLAARRRSDGRRVRRHAGAHHRGVHHRDHGDRHQRQQDVPERGRQSDHGQLIRRRLVKAARGLSFLGRSLYPRTVATTVRGCFSLPFVQFGILNARHLVYLACGILLES